MSRSHSMTNIHSPGGAALTTPRRVSLDCRLSMPAWLPLSLIQGALGAIGIRLTALPTRGRRPHTPADAERGARSTC